MATFLTTNRIVDHLYRIIGEATEEVVLVSAYINLDDATKERLDDKAKTSNIPIHIIYGKKKRKLKSEEKAHLDSLGIRVSFVKDLHAKCYLNEKEALVTSMNLLESSMEHNEEMGILVSRADDPEVYDAIYREAIRLSDASSESYVVTRNKAKPGVAGTRSRTTGRDNKRPRDGFCIRCKNHLIANPEQPYCLPCYKTSHRHSNPDYEDNYCHICGNEYAATLLKPLCRTCHAKYKDVFQFASR